MSYHYLVASLPMLFFGEPPPWPAAEFRRRCAGVLSPDHLVALDLVLAGRGGEAAHPFARAWACRETQLRNEAVLARASRHGADGHALLRPHAGYDVGVRQAVADAFAKATPLDREMELDRARWRVLDELARGDPFGLSAVLAFGLKLRIAERWAALTEEHGRAALEARLAAAARAAASGPPTPAPGTHP